MARLAELREAARQYEWAREEMLLAARSARAALGGASAASAATTVAAASGASEPGGCQPHSQDLTFPAPLPVPLLQEFAGCVSGLVDAAERVSRQPQGEVRAGGGGGCAWVGY